MSATQGMEEIFFGGDKFFGGAELDKGKVKMDVVNPEGDTLFKDTIGKEDAVNFILGMGDPKGEKFQIKTDKDVLDTNKVSIIGYDESSNKVILNTTDVVSTQNGGYVYDLTNNSFTKISVEAFHVLP